MIQTMLDAAAIEDLDGGSLAPNPEPDYVPPADGEPVTYVIQIAE